MRTVHLTAIVLVAAALTAGGVYAARDIAASAPPSLAAYAPPGALLAIESPDFAALLHSWNNSAEQRRWLAGDDYAAFSRSRLFGRLGDAQSGFATAAGLAPDSQFLEQVAGSQSLLAWYDIGNLEFLYITRLSPEQASRVPLLALRDKFEQRQAGGVTFYIRNSEDVANPTPATPDDGGGDSRPRTVAFAVRGDLLLLATREDLIAGALEQMSRSGGRSLVTDSWYAASVAAAKEKQGDLRLTLDLAKISRSPYFRTYWAQQNITAIHRYSAALSDLYREPGAFREERFLLPSGADQSFLNTDLTPVLHFLPAGVVYRAVGRPSADDTLAELEDKLLLRTSANTASPRQAPSADLSVPIAGDSSDLDDYIDTAKAPTDVGATAFTPLRSLLNSSAPVAMLSISSAAALDTSAASRESSDRSNIFGTIHNGVVIATGTSCDTAAWQHALTAALSAKVSVGDAGLRWREQPNAKVPWFRLDGAFPLAFAADGNNCLLASDSGTMLAMLSANDAPTSHQASASSMAGFSHTTQRAPLLQLVGLLDRRSGRNPGAAGEDNNKPPFFSGNMASLSNTFEDLDSETFTEFQASPTVTRQTVRYLMRQR
jgi:hypothetical protein